jgi:hypothetical protein
MNLEDALSIELRSITEFSKEKDETTIYNIYPLNAPEGVEAPYLVYLSGELMEVKSLDGFISYGNVNIELNILALEYSDMKDLSKKVLTLIKTFLKRKIGDDGPYIQNLTLDPDSPEMWEEQVKLYRKIISFNIKF